jgi:hypothetical protein
MTVAGDGDLVVVVDDDDDDCAHVVNVGTHKNSVRIRVQ